MVIEMLVKMHESMVTKHDDKVIFVVSKGEIFHEIVMLEGINCQICLDDEDIVLIVIDISFNGIFQGQRDRHLSSFLYFPND